MFVLNHLGFPGLAMYRFPDDGAGSGDGGNSGGTETDNSGGDDDPDNSSGDDGAQGEGQKTFTQEELNAILAKEKSKATRGKIDPKSLGFDSQKDLEAFVKAQKDKAEKDQSEEEKKLAQAIKDAEDKARTEVMSVANTRLIKSEFRVAAIEAGIPRKALDDAFLLAQNLEDWEVEVDDDGEVNGLTPEFFKTLKKEKPFLFNGQSKDPAENDAGGGAGAGGRGKGADEAQLRERFPGLANVQ